MQTITETITLNIMKLRNNTFLILEATRAIVYSSHLRGHKNCRPDNNAFSIETKKCLQMCTKDNN